MSAAINTIHIIPFSGPPLEYEGEGTARTIFSPVEHGFLIGPENYALEPIVRWVVDGKVSADRLPIFLYGPYGVGRTHLLRGMLEAWRSNQPAALKRHAYLLSARDFARQFSDALDTKTPEDFRHRYRKAALLLIDDLNLLDDCPWAQEELLHTLDALCKQGGIPVLSSDSLPSEVSAVGKEKSPPILPALTARLLGGTAIPVLPPGVEVRKHFLRDIAAAFRRKLPESVLASAALALPLTIPSLYGAFAQMCFEADAEGIRVDGSFVKEFLKNKTKNNRPTMDALAKRTAKHFSLKLSELRGGSRNKTVSLARSIAIFLARRQAGLHVNEIAKYFGNRDPSTIRHSIEKIQKNLLEDTSLRDQLFRLGFQ